MKQAVHIERHPILGELPSRKEIIFFFNGEPVKALEGDTVAAALVSCGVRVFRDSARRHDPRGVFCSIGHCNDCVMTIDGVPSVRSCITCVREGMQVLSEGADSGREAD